MRYVYIAAIAAFPVLSVIRDRIKTFFADIEITLDT